MPTTSRWGISPHESVDLECARRGRDPVIDGCVALLGGALPGGRSTGREQANVVDGQLVFALGGPLASWALEDGQPQRTYWVRVWAARGLLYAWDDRAAPAVIEALADEHWRVREMAARVSAKHRIDDAVPALAALGDDERERVRQAADIALARITAAS